MKNDPIKIFLDSGAFSAWSKKKEIDIMSYISFIKSNSNKINHYANLDVIGNPKETWKNQCIMEENGLSPIPIFHYGEDEKWIKKYLEKGNKYIGLGGMVPIHNNTLIKWLDRIFKNYLVKNKTPILKVHGFGMTTLRLILRYPWYSVDSSSWRLRGGGFGLIDLPVNPKLIKKDDFHINSIPIAKGVKNYTKVNGENKGLFNLERLSQGDLSMNKMGEVYKKESVKLLKSYGFDFEELCNNYMLRSVWNAIYLLISVKKFTNTQLYFATNELRSVRLLRKHMKINNMDLNDLNVLFSYYNVPKSGESKFLENLIRLKNLSNRT